MNDEKTVRLLGFSCYYRQGASVFNSKGKKLTPDAQGRYKLKVYRGCYRYYRPPSNAIEEESRLSQEEYDSLPVLEGFSNYRITKDKKIITKTRRILYNKKGIYHLKNDNNEYRNLRLLP